MKKIFIILFLSFNALNCAESISEKKVSSDVDSLIHDFATLLTEKKVSSDTDSLSILAYKTKAQEIIDSVISLSQGLPDDMEKFLTEQAQNLSKLKSQTLNIKQTLKTLDPSWIFLFTMNDLDSKKGAKFIYEFALKANELLAHRLRKILKVYVTEVADFELEYASQMNKVTEKEFSEKLEKLPSAQIDNLLIEEASKLAEYMLKKIDG